MTVREAFTETLRKSVSAAVWTLLTSGLVWWMTQDVATSAFLLAAFALFTAFLASD